MFTQYEAQEKLKIDGYCMASYERKKSQEVKFLWLCRKDNG